VDLQVVDTNVSEKYTVSIFKTEEDLGSPTRRRDEMIILTLIVRRIGDGWNWLRIMCRGWLQPSSSAKAVLVISYARGYQPFPDVGPHSHCLNDSRAARL
jgi:hypothetical protein